MDAYHIFRKMRREGFFSLHAALRATPSAAGAVRAAKGLDDLTADTLSADTLTGVLDLDAVDVAAAAYHAVRAREEGGGAPAPVAGELRALVMQHERIKYTRSVAAAAPPTDEAPRKPRTPQVGRGKKKSVGGESSAEAAAAAAAGGGVGGAVVRYNMESGEAMVGGADMLGVEHMPEIGEFFAPPPDEESPYVQRALKHSAAELEAPPLEVSMHHVSAATDTDMATAPPAAASPQATAVLSTEPKRKGRRLSATTDSSTKRPAASPSSLSRTTRRSAKNSSTDVRSVLTVNWAFIPLHYLQNEAVLEAASGESVQPERRSRSTRQAEADE